MMRCFFAAVAILFEMSAADAGPLARLRGAVPGGSVTANQAAAMAASGRVYHSGRYAAGASHEGCGFSTVSAQDAVRHCCYWGQLTPVSISVRRGANGWFACVQYR